MYVTYCTFRGFLKLRVIMCLSAIMAYVLLRTPQSRKAILIASAGSAAVWFLRAAMTELSKDVQLSEISSDSKISS